MVHPQAFAILSSEECKVGCLSTKGDVLRSASVYEISVTPGEAERPEREPFKRHLRKGFLPLEPDTGYAGGGKV